jgi:hypothetical protein
VRHASIAPTLGSSSTATEHLRAQLLAIHVHPESTPPEPYVIAHVFEADALRTIGGWRFQTLNLRPIWSTGQSHFDIGTNEQ